MEVLKKKSKGNLITKTWKKCTSFRFPTKISKFSIPKPSSLQRSNSWSYSRPRTLSPDDSEREDGNNNNNRSEHRKNNNNKAQGGCFPVYVGAERQRFAVKTHVLNHPLFQMLLEDAEKEYGYDNEGPIRLPCDVDLFYTVLAEIENGINEDSSSDYQTTIGCVRSPLIGLGTTSRQKSFLKGNDIKYRVLNPPSIQCSS